MRGLGNEKAPMRCCTGADMLLFAFLINWRNLIQYEHYGKTYYGGYAYNAGHGIMAIHGKAIGYKPEEEDEYGGKNLPQRALEKTSSSQWSSPYRCDDLPASRSST